MPLCASLRASLSAPRLVRTNTRLVPCVRFRKLLSHSAFSAAGTRCPMCSMVLASPSSRPTRIIFGARMIWFADCATSSDIVAENSSVCRFGGSDATMRRTLGQNPMSSMRSASSSTSTSRLSNFAALVPM